MPWFWTDDLANLLIDQDGYRPDSLTEWTRRPAALAAPEGIDPLEFARSLTASENEAVA
jgi:hypothetical protein